MDISSRIKLVRKHSKLSQTEFGEKLSVSRNVINDAENGRVIPKELFLQHLCTVFSVSYDWLESGTGEPFRRDAATIVDQLAEAYHLDTADRAMVESYIELDDFSRKVIKDYVRTLAEKLAADAPQQYQIPAKGNAAATITLTDGDRKGLAKIKDDLLQQDDADKLLK